MTEKFNIILKHLHEGSDRTNEQKQRIKKEMENKFHTLVACFTDSKVS